MTVGGCRGPRSLTGRAAPLQGDLTVDEYGAIVDFLRRKKLLSHVSLVSSGILYGGQVVSSVAEAKRVFGYKPPRKR